MQGAGAGSAPVTSTFTKEAERETRGIFADSYESKHISDWTTEEVEAFLFNFCDVETPMPQSYSAITGRELCAFDEDQRLEFLEKMGFPFRIYGKIVSKLTLLVHTPVPPSPPQIQQSPASEADCRETLIKHSEQFISNYIDKFGAVQRFTKYIFKCLTTFQRSKDSYFAPYVTLVQSSGYGKSRLLRETAKQVVTLYVCLRPDPSSGYPRRTVKAEQALFGDLSAIKNRFDYVTVLIKRLGLLCHNAVRMKHQLVDSKESEASIVGDKRDKIIQSALFPSERNPEVWDLKEIDYKVSVDLQESPIILALDEARELLKPIEDLGVSRFRLLREALRAFSKDVETQKYGLIAVFVDTNSKIHNFTPTLQDDHSAREGSEVDEMYYKNLKLFHPFIIGETFDLLLEDQVDQDLSQLIHSTKYLHAGRPLVAQGAGFDFLKRKLMGGSAEVTADVSLGVMLCRVAAFVCPRHSLAVDLVAGHMATLLACDKERRGILSTYVAEPRLAIAAAQIWHERENFFPNHGVEALQSALMSGALSQGIRGEVVGQIVLLLAFDAACKAASKEYGDCVDLMKVLEQLLPSESPLEILFDVVPESLRSAKVACCQFVQLAHKFNPKTRILLAERHCGASFQERQRGADAVIPILSTVHGFLMIQFKNLSSCQNHCGYSSVACSELLPSKVFVKDDLDPTYVKKLDLTSIRLFMQVGADSASSQCVDEGRRANKKGPPALEIFGLQSRCLSNEHQAALKVLVHGNVGLSTYLEDSADLEPNPDPGFEKARNSWPFVIERGSDTSDAAVKVALFILI